MIGRGGFIIRRINKMIIIERKSRQTRRAKKKEEKKRVELRLGRLVSR
jgi:hypothetical protein